MSDLFDKVADIVATDKDYYEGMKACEDGEMHDMSRSLEYTAGFNRQYHLEQQESARSTG